MIKLGWKRDKGESMGLVCVVVWGTCTIYKSGVWEKTEIYKFRK